MCLYQDNGAYNNKAGEAIHPTSFPSRSKVYEKTFPWNHNGFYMSQFSQLYKNIFILYVANLLHKGLV